MGAGPYALGDLGRRPNVVPCPPTAMPEEFSDRQLAAEIELLVSVMVAASHSDRHLTDAEVDELLCDPEVLPAVGGASALPATRTRPVRRRKRAARTPPL